MPVAVGVKVMVIDQLCMCCAAKQDIAADQGEFERV